MTSHLRSITGRGSRQIILTGLAIVSCAALPLFAANSPLPAPVILGSSHTEVPVLSPNFSQRAETWSFNLPSTQREPFSYARQQRLIDLYDPPPRPVAKPLTEVFSTAYAAEQNLYSTGLEDSAAGRHEQARRHLQECLTRLNGTLAQTRLIQATAAQDSRELAQANFYLTSALRLQEAARQALKQVAVREQFETQVLRADAFEVRAILAPAEAAGAADGSNASVGAVLFAGYPTPYKAGDRIVLPATGTGAAVEIKILALSRTVVTVLFDHQSSFEIPILLDAPAGGNSPAGKH